MVFFSNGLVGSITGLALFLLFLPLISLVIRKLRGGWVRWLRCPRSR
jgi:hypothetical protein